MSPVVAEEGAFGELLSRLVGLQGRHVLVRVSTVDTPPLAAGHLDTVLGFAGPLGGRFDEDPDREGVLFVQVGGGADQAVVGGLVIPRERLQHVNVAADSDGVSYAVDGMVVRIDPLDLPDVPEPGESS